MFKRIFILVAMASALVAMALPLSAAAFARGATVQECGKTDTCSNLSATITMVDHFTQTFKWGVTKTANPDFQDLTGGGTGSSHYVITVSRDAGTEAAWFTGCVNVVNTNRGDTPPATGVVVTAQFTDSADTILVPSTILTGPSTIAADGVSVCYPYTFTVPANLIANNASFSVDAKVRADNNYTLNREADDALAAGPELIHDSITVFDTFNNHTTGPFSGDQIADQYDRVFTCPKDEGNNPNRATTVFADGSFGDHADANVNVECPGVPPVPTPVPTQGTTTTTTTTFTPGLPNTGSDPNP
jgi:hypothetical protein